MVQMIKLDKNIKAFVITTLCVLEGSVALAAIVTEGLVLLPSHLPPPSLNIIGRGPAVTMRDLRLFQHQAELPPPPAAPGGRGKPGRHS